MHHFLVANTRATSLPEIIGSIKHTPNYCALEHDVEGEACGRFQKSPVQYTGPLMQAPDGTYPLWQCLMDTPLRILERKVLLGTQLLLKLPVHAAGGIVLDEKARVAFKDLLVRSEKLVHVYQEDGTGRQEYLFLWPGQPAPETYKDRPNFTYRGIADLTTGKVTNAPR